MTQSERSRIVFRTAVGVVATIGLLAGTGDALAARRNKKKQVKPAEVSNLQTPLGLQGRRGAGNNVVTPFSLVDKSRRKSDVEAQYGFDVNGDGIIADGTDPNLPSEYFDATEDRRDARNTRKNKKPQLFTTAGDIGSSHAFVWNSSADLGTAHLPTIQIKYTPQGRPVPDPNNPGSFEFEKTLAGVKLRLRAKAKKGGAVSEWSYSDAFALNNNTPPSMTIDEIIPNTTSSEPASDEIVEIRWTAIDEDSEDFNGNGDLDPLDLEDINGNGVLDPEPVAVAFDYWRVPDGVDPSQMTPEQLEGLIWQPCTRAPGVGDPDDGVPSAPERATGGANQHTFAWDSLKDVGTVRARFILRAKPFDSKNESGGLVYNTDGFLLDNHTVFNHPNTNADLPAGRIGTASVNLVPGLPRSDPLYQPPLQSLLITGGSAQADGPGTTYLAVVAANTETAETTTASAIPYAVLSDARSYHTATLLDDGRVLLAGGFDATGTPIATTEIYDPATHELSAGPQLLTARAKHSAVLLPSGDVLFVGGVGASGSPLASAEIYTFTPFGAPAEPNASVPDLAVAQHSAHAVLLPDQRVLVTGGIGAGGTAVQTAQVLNTLNNADSDPTTKEPVWVTVGSMAEARKLASATVLSSGHVLFAGGAASPAKASMELFNWQTSQFEPLSNLTFNGQPVTGMPDGGRADHTAALLGNGWVMLAGGTSDPDVTGAVTGQADIFQLGTRDDGTGTWSGTFMNVNGDMKFPRRGAEAVAINNGRILVVGGRNATGGALAESEVYTPRGGLNARPSTRTDLESRQQSWAYGAPIVYRVTDAEQDDVRVVVQWSDNGGSTWNAAAPQASTIGGDLAEATAGISSGASDDESLAISPKAYPTSDHQYIWSMTSDIARPPQGGSAGPYIFRVIPYGAVRGAAAQSVPVTVLYNTKVIPTIVPLESRDGVPGAEQGGDIHIWVHFRDIDGDVVPGPGDPAQALFEYAIDANGDGSINDGAEFWTAMSRSGAARFPASRQDNLLEGITTYSEPFDQSGNAPGNRLAEQGWAMFPWDSVYDLGAPASSRADVFIRVRPFDNLTGVEPDEGFTGQLFNEAGKPESFRLIRDPAALWLTQFSPAGGNKLAVSVNEPLYFDFNGLVDPTSVNEQTIQVRLGGTQVFGVFTTEQDVDSFTTRVTFFPRLNSTVLDELVYSEFDNPTVLFPFNNYSVFIPGYQAGDEYPLGVETLQPDLSIYPATPDETFLLVQNVQINDSFTTGQGNYDDGTAVQVVDVFPASGNEFDLNNYADGVTFSYSGGLDLDTVRSPFVTFTVDNSGGTSSAKASKPVVPTQMTITNEQDPVTGLTTSTVQIVPLLHLPSGRTVNVQTTSGLMGANGLPVEASLLEYTVADYGSADVTGSEDFSDDDFEDTSVSNRASWGLDLCNPGTLTGLQGAGTPPQGGADLLVQANQVATITNSVNDYNNITVEKGGTLRIRASSAVTIRATGNITIAGKVDFRGMGGWSKVAGNVSTTSYYTIGPRGTKPDIEGGEGFNGGADGGAGTHSGTNRTAGENGSGNEYGQGGRVASTASRYYYGAGGGAGGGHGAPGLPGGMAAAYTTSSAATSYGDFSVPGGTTGDPDMITGPSAGGAGGGGGSSSYYPSAGTSGAWYHTGGGGGASAGAVTFVCDGVFDLRPSGCIDGRGGDGGGSVMYGGGGGGGAGGGLKITAGQRADLDGVIDLRGGKGGPRHQGYGYSDSYNRYVAYHGSVRFGGDGGPGRFVVQAPNFADSVDVRVKGQLMVDKIQQLPTPVGTAVTAPSVFGTGGSIDYGDTSAVHYTELVIPANTRVDITGNKALTIYADKVDIQGTLRINGERPQYGWDSTRLSGISGYAPTRAYFYNSSVTATRPSGYKGGEGELGGGTGGLPYRTSGTASRANAFLAQGTDGTGPSPGLNVMATDPGYYYSYSGSYTYSYFYYYADGGGGGGGNATQGGEGWAPYGQGAYYTYTGGVNDTSGEGHSQAKRLSYIDNGGAPVDPTNITVTNLANYAGGGGGGGNAGSYRYSYQSGSYSYGYLYSGVASGAGAGAGAIALVGADTLSVSGTIEANGGDGNLPGDAYYYYYAHSGAGAGAGGSIMLIGADVTIDPVTNINDATSGATISAVGGIGGGWRLQWLNSATLSRHPAYNSMGNFGGDGGYGRVVVQYTDSLNGGSSLFNRGGMEHVAFDDIYRRYTVLSGSARAQCLGGSNGGSFRSSWYDLNSVAPVVDGLTVDVVGKNTDYTLQGEGAQSHPHDLGDGTGAPDPNVTSGMQDPGSAMLDGWRWFRFGGALNRASADPREPAPLLDDIEWPFSTDDVD